MIAKVRRFLISSVSDILFSLCVKMAELFSELFSLGITRLSKDLGYIGLLHIRLASKVFQNWYYNLS
ncbi:hypothetical protein EA456_08780 [Streptococcus dysgalactiae subsp. dysgalactiae]|nr:hypothetical protein [Streptococcus dysgalactiae]ORJ91187.1 hypothetical protein B7O95_03590 [Streptococcus dysgalactiae subsp. equisimilis]QGH00544.1 hypothetical protein EA456_08780 [Streptococcus dysgalactiae subsp. dysgalactiae]PXX84517.1 hypothetical protein DI495_02160 [Streptococcus dysgalactiae subsp. equisimilis]QET83818.1 hypothetical protein FOB62_08835 [Streptococcus dysgalactiae]